MSAKTTISVVEAAYDLEGSERHWLRRISAAAAPALDRGLGLISYGYDARNVPLKVSTVVYLDVPPRIRPLFLKSIEQTDANYIQNTYNNRLSFASVREQSPALPDWLEAAFARGGIHDVIGVNALQGDGTGVVLTSAVPRRWNISRDLAWRWSLVAAHIAAGARLRRGLLTGRPLPSGEAILEPDGRVAHARGVAKAKDARAALHRAVRDMERARGRLRGSDPDEALQIWRALVSGRWSLVDSFDSDGRRFLIARRNDPQLSDPRRLTRRERQVVAFAAIGHPNKLIAYELGLGPTTVSSHLRSAMVKLGVRTRAELLRRLR